MPSRAEPDDVARYTGRTVLVIDDDAKSGDAAREALEALGVRAIVAVDAATGLRIIETSAVDLVFWDLELPGPEGVGFMARIAAQRGTGHPPIIAMSDRGSTEAMLDSRERGFRAYVVKPLTPEILRLLLRALF
jgi:DNA-binding response OmpR family regulator